MRRDASLLACFASALPVLAPHAGAQCATVHWWPGNHHLLDVGAGAHATNVGASFEPGVAGAGFAFDGSGAHLRIPSDPSLDLGIADFTIEMWIRPDSIAGRTELLHRRLGSGVKELELRIGADNDGDGLVFFQTNDGQSVRVVSPNPVPVGSFTYLAVTRNAGVLTLYLNGQAVDSSAGPVQDVSSTADILIGEFNSQPVPGISNPFDGVIDEIRVSHRAYSATEVTGAYPGEGGPPLHHWPGEANADDAAGMLHGVASPGVAYGPGREGCGFVLDGNDAHVTIPHDASLDLGTADFTIDLWIRPDNSVRGALFHKRNGSGVRELELRYGYLSDDRIIYFQTNDGVNLGITSSQPLDVGAFTRLTVVRRGCETALYIDGHLDGVRIGAPQNVNSSSDLLLGEFVSVPIPGISAPFTGMMDEVKLFTRAMSAAEVAARHSDSGPPTAVAGSDLAAHPGDSVQLDGTGSFDDDTHSAQLLYTWTITERPVGSSASLINPFTSTPTLLTDLPGEYEAQLVVEDAAGAQSCPDAVSVSTTDLAPTALIVARALALVGSSVALDGSSSTDPEGAPLTYAWRIVAGPIGSAASISGGSEQQATLTPDVAGRYEIGLVVSDAIGPSEEVVHVLDAVESSEFAVLQSVAAFDRLSDLTGQQVTNQGNKNALASWVSEAATAIQEGRLAPARNHLSRAITRVDGVALRGAVNLSGPGRDWVTDPAAQLEIYELLSLALEAISM